MCGEDKKDTAEPSTINDRGGGGGGGGGGDGGGGGGGELGIESSSVSPTSSREIGTPVSLNSIIRR